MSITTNRSTTITPTAQYTTLVVSKATFVALPANVTALNNNPIVLDYNAQKANNAGRKNHIILVEKEARALRTDRDELSKDFDTLAAAYTTLHGEVEELKKISAAYKALKSQPAPKTQDNYLLWGLGAAALTAVVISNR